MRSVAYIWAVLAILTGPLAHVRADEPTLARLSFWAPPERMSEFEATYEEQVVPFLKKHGLVESSQRGRATVDSVFSRLFEFDSPIGWSEKSEALEKDPAGQKLLLSLGTQFGTTRPDSLMRSDFNLYTAPAGAGKTVVAGPGKTVEIGSGFPQKLAGPGKTIPVGPAKTAPAGPGKTVLAGPGKTVLAGPGKAVPAGAGFRQGVWQNFSIEDGLPSNFILDILEDGKGHLWFGTTGGVSRFDGTHFTTFTTDDGLASNWAWSIVEDREGHLWFGTRRRGVSRFDGTHFTTDDGLASNWAWSIVEDREGHLWFGTDGGVSRFDGTHFTTFTTDDGLAHNRVWPIMEDRRGNLWFGTEGGVSRYDGTQFTTFTVKDGLADKSVSSIGEDRQGHLWFGTDGGVSRFDGKHFTTFTTEDGLESNKVHSIMEDRHGTLWILTDGGGVSRFDGTHFTTFNTEDGLAHNRVFSVMEDRHGTLWVGTYGGGVSRFDKDQFTTFTTEDGLATNRVLPIWEDRHGNLWFGTDGGVSRFDGTRFTTFTAEDGLAHNRVRSFGEDRHGALWIGTYGGGVSRFDGTKFTTFTTEDGLKPHARSILEDRKGHLWFGGSLVSRYDGKEFVTFTTEDGLVSNFVWSMLEDRQGNLWFAHPFGSGRVSRYDGVRFTTLSIEGLTERTVEESVGALCIVEDRQGNLWFTTNGGGVARFDGQQFTNFTTEDGLGANWLWSMLEDRQGHLWFASRGGGVNRYDGLVFQTLSRKDGLAHDEVWSIHQDRQGAFWFATEGGLTRYRPSSTPPAIHLEVVADRRYGSIQELEIPSSQEFLTFEFQGRSMTTRPDGMVYVYRLQGYDDAWRTTRTTEVEYTDLPRGNYVFQVKAVDRDLNYSDPATVKVTIHPPYGFIVLVSGLGLALVFAAVTSGYAIRKRRDLRRAERALMLELEDELQTAHDMQMGLMPQKQPRISGFNIAGRCLPANHVGGDLFQYFDRPHNRLAISMADVTGHAMEAAIPVVMFSGILDTQLEAGDPLEDLFAKLNRSMHRNLNRRNFVCFAMGELDPATRTFRLSNGGCPFPYHYQAANGDIVELQVETYPLGVKSDTTYQVIEVQLEPGDYVVFCSDGIAEARNAAGELFGFERTAETVRQGCVEELSATALIDRLLGEVQAFSGDHPQEDDQTIVVVGVES